MLLFVPETQRKIVGNGSTRVKGIYWSAFSLLQRKDSPGKQSEFTPPARRFPNPFISIKILRNKESLLIIIIFAINYAVKNTLQTSLGSQGIHIYDLDYIQAGLIYLPMGIGSAMGSFCTGKSGHIP